MVKYKNKILRRRMPSSFHHSDEDAVQLFTVSFNRWFLQNDFSKYSSAVEAIKISEVWKTISSVLAKIK